MLRTVFSSSNVNLLPDDLIADEREPLGGPLPFFGCNIELSACNWL